MADWIYDLNPRDNESPPPKRVDLTKCPYCGEAVTFSPTSAHIYRQDYGPIWECVPCEALVGCHKARRKGQSGKVPLGIVATKPDRELRKAAHVAFDPLWKAKVKHVGWTKKRARSTAYQWLADQLGIPVEQCHISQMNSADVRRVATICEPYRAAIAAREALRGQAVPGEVGPDYLRGVLVEAAEKSPFMNAANEEILNPAAIIEMLVDCGLLYRNRINRRLQFAYDPVAEQLAALS